MDVFDANWKEAGEDNVSGYCSLSEEVAYGPFL